ncbi:MAG: energy transducer TonB [Saprospiraceae bacterium]|nr:energy transducer TonB [Saprospiraceae bacterium]
MYRIIPCLLLLASVAQAQPDSSGVWTLVEQMPFFQGCEHLLPTDPAKRSCSEKALAAFISSKLTYPDSAAARRLEGMVVVSFVVDEEGNPGDVRIVRDIGAGCGAAARAVVDAMPKWEPAMHEGRKVPVRLNLPILFSFKRGVTDESEQFTVHWGTLNAEAVTAAELKQHLDEAILVRDPFGNLVDIRDVEFMFEKGRKSSSAKASGNMPDKKMRKVAEQVSAGGTFTVAAGIQYGNASLLVTRSYEIK